MGGGICLLLCTVFAFSAVRKLQPQAMKPHKSKTPAQVTKRDDGGNGCDQGIFAAAAAYDKFVGRYLMTAVCDDYLNPRILLAVSSLDGITDYWSLYSVPADNQPTTWKCSNGRRAYPDYTQVRLFGSCWGSGFLQAQKDSN
jgi:hypothetical protein